MTTLISQWQDFYGESEDDCAARMRFSYGLLRACQVAEIYSGRLQAPTLRAFWWRVGYILSQERNDHGGLLLREHEGYKQKSPGQLSVTVNGVKITRAQFLAEINTGARTSKN